MRLERFASEMDSLRTLMWWLLAAPVLAPVLAIIYSVRLLRAVRAWRDAATGSD